MPVPAVSNSPLIHGAITRQVLNSGERVVAVSAKIMADRRQLLYALTLPEYLEAWLTPPDADFGQERVAMRSGTAYALEYRDLHGERAMIEGVFRAANRDKVMLTCRRKAPYQGRQSVVTIRLNGDFAFTALQLTHTGVMADSEYCWSRDLWEISLSRLKSLLEGGRARDFDISPAAFSH